ncbi:MAG: DUF485 domain-containing protein [Phycisphaerae bacterium]|jgi:uncharacterized membrane protein (DUF485 family)
MFHEPSKTDNPNYAVGYKSKLGILMFVIYAVIYAGFVAVNVAKPVLMEKQIIFGQNLAVVYGLGLIIFALILAMIYNHLCTCQERRESKNAAEGGQK